MQPKLGSMVCEKCEEKLTKVIVPDKVRCHVPDSTISNRAVSEVGRYDLQSGLRCNLECAMVLGAGLLSVVHISRSGQKVA